MTDQVQQPVDPFQQVWQSIQESAALLKSRIKQGKTDAGKPVTAGALAAIIEGDVFQFLATSVQLMAQLRDGMAQALSSMESRLDDLEGRVDGETTTITPEDGTALRQVVIDLREMVVASRNMHSVPDDKLSVYEQHAAAAEAILDEATLVEDEDGEGDDEGEGDEAAGAEA